MQIELAGLEGTGRTFAHTYEPGELVLPDERVTINGPAEISGRVVRKRDEVDVKGKVAAQLEVECDRCLQRIEIAVDTDFELRYLTREQYTALKAEELTEEDLTFSVFDGEFIDIDEVMREQLLLAVPTQVLCREDCKGLCAVCGADLNIVQCSCVSSQPDPRWSPLKRLLNRE